MSQTTLKTAVLWQRALQKTREQGYLCAAGSPQTAGASPPLPPLVERQRSATPAPPPPSPNPSTLGTHPAPSPSHPAPRVMLRKTVSFQSVAHQLLQKSRKPGAERQQSRDRELKAKVEELENLRTEHEKEKEEKKRLQGELVAARERHAAVEQRLAEAQQRWEKLRLESQQKQEQIEKYQRDISHMEDRIRNLEMRASEVDKAELNLESTRRNLESSQMECRLRENDIRKLTSQYEETCRQLDAARRQVEELEGKIKDLKFQVRHELVKNERIEQGLERIPQLEEQLTEQSGRISSLEREAAEKTALLASARKAIREYKDRLREMENQQELVGNLNEELRVARCEISTLKRLMSGKDTLVQQKCQAISLAKSVIDSFAGSLEERERLRRLQTALERLSTLSSTAGGWTEEDGEATDTATEYAATHSSATTSTSLARSSSTRRRAVSARQQQQGEHHHHSNHTNHSSNHGGSSGGRGGEISVNVPPYALQDGGRASPSDAQDNNDCAFLERVGGHQHQHGQQHHQHQHHQHHQHQQQHQQQARSVGGQPRPRTAVVSPSVRRTKSFNDSPALQGRRGGPAPTARSLRSVSSSCESGGGASSGSSSHYRSERRAPPSSRFAPSLDYPLGPRGEDRGGRQQPGLANGSHRHLPPHSAKGANSSSAQARGDNCESDEGEDPQRGAAFRQVAEEQLLAVSRMSGRQRDKVLASVIHLGDRVTAVIPPPSSSSSSHRHPSAASRTPAAASRNKRAKPAVYTGLVKYKGTLDKEYDDASLYLGLRLDEPIGESDGTYKGKRYMYTPPQQGHFLRIRDVTSVLDVQCGSYVSCKDLLLGYLGHKQALQLQQQQQLAYDTD